MGGWTRQPPAGTPIDRSNPLTLALDDRFTLSDPLTYSVAAGAPTYEASSQGLGFYGSMGLLGRKSYATWPAAFTWAALAVGKTGGAAYQTIIGGSQGTGGVYPYIGAQSGTWFEGGADIYGPTFTSAPTALIAASYVGTAVSFYVNGRLQGTGSLGAHPLTVGGAATAMSVGYDWPSVANSFSGILLLGLFYSRLLAAYEHAALAGNPWQIFAPSHRRLYVLPASGGGGAISGSAVVSFLASGALSAPGALSGAGQLAFGAAGTLTGPGVISGSGTLSFNAAGALAGIGAVSGAGELSFGATGTLTQPGAIQGTARVTFSGAAALLGRGALAAGAELGFDLAGALVNGSGIPMPQLVGLNYYEALEVLQDAGIYLPVIAYAFRPSSISVKWAKSTLNAGFVAGQSIAAGLGVSAGAPVTLTLSQFPFNAVIDMPPDWKQVN